MIMLVHNAASRSALRGDNRSMTVGERSESCAFLLAIRL